MTVRPTVSVVVNNYNYARFLPMALDSALAQTYAQVEVVAVDDGSTDGSRAVLERYSTRVRVVLRENGGQAAAVNSGYRASTGDVVIFLDADDELAPQACARIADLLGPDVGKVHFRLEGIDAEGRPLGWLHPSRRVSLPAGDLAAVVLRDGAYTTPVMTGNAFPRTVLERILPVPEDDFRISADGYLVTAAALAGRVVAVDEPLGRYRLHGDNAWSSSSSAGLDRIPAYVRHDLARHRALRQLADAWGLPVADSMGGRDPSHLQRRLASLRLSPGGHPVPSDTRPRLALGGAMAALRSTMSVPRRLQLITWFVVAAVVPRRVVRPVLARGLVARRRPRSPLRSLIRAKDVAGAASDAS